MRSAVLLAALLALSTAAIDSCKDRDFNCRDWVGVNPRSCQTTEYIKNNCRQSCGLCGNSDKRDVHNSRQYDVGRLPQHLTPIAWLVGRWRSEHGGKAIFPTIPKFTYGEEISFGIPSDNTVATKGLNYTAFAWSINERDELHSEQGYVVVKPNTREVSMTTVMNNGFVTVEEGQTRGQSIRFKLVDIGRISFSRDLPVHDTLREWTLLDRNTLQARFNMETLTHGMQEHTFIRYNKIE